MRRPLVFTLLGLWLAAAVLPALPAHAAPAAIAETIVFTPLEDTKLEIAGLGPFHGQIEVRREGGHVLVINELDLDAYVRGVREVPGMWHMEALRSQAVAARTYALWERERGYWQRFGFDVCGTTSCQVYQGAAAEEGERGRRWAEAVNSTAREVLLFEGAPALTRYHSSSGGQTLPNELVYPSSGPRPYLSSVRDQADEVSPLHTWTVRFSRSDLQRILHEGIGLVGELREITTDQQTRRLTIRTAGGELEMNIVRFRRVVSAKAAELFGDRYPSTREDGEKLPIVLPSSRFDVERDGDTFIIRGRGYGHGVGMSQWGAKGRADRGETYEQILGTYYTGLRPTRWEGPTRMRVAVVRDGTEVTVAGDGVFEVRAGDQQLAASTLGGWRVSTSGARSLGVQPPAGHELPLVLSGLTAPDELHIDPPASGSTLDVGFVVPKSAEITTVVSQHVEGRTPIVAEHTSIVDAGERVASLVIDPGVLPERDTYTIEVTAFDGVETKMASREIVLTRPGDHLLRYAMIGVALVLAVSVFYRVARRQSSTTAEVSGQTSPHG